MLPVKKTNKSNKKSTSKKGAPATHQSACKVCSSSSKSTQDAVLGTPTQVADANAPVVPPRPHPRPCPHPAPQPSLEPEAPLPNPVATAFPKLDDAECYEMEMHLAADEGGEADLLGSVDNVNELDKIDEIDELESDSDVLLSALADDSELDDFLGQAVDAGQAPHQPKST
ncbi:hypothetical protein FRC08_013451 [Ceratobasidium sp. 394]|nr:hypothetical protein FRC08_013451 [Ceratobasidium sp. 394]